MSKNDSGRNRVRPLAALRALRTVVNDPEQTPKVFEFIRALSGPSLAKGYRRFRKTRKGRRILAQEFNLIDILRDRERLASLPPGSLGRAYYDFIYGEDLSAEELVEASIDPEAPQEVVDAGLSRYAERLRDQHDLWHTLTGYGRDTLGEACLLGFTYAQTRNRGVGLLAIVGAHRLRGVFGNDAPRAVWRGYRDGRRASWLPATDWENLLPLPIERVRRLLGIKRPRMYRILRAELDAVMAELEAPAAASQASS